MNNRIGAVLCVCHALLLAGCVVTRDGELTDAPDAANARYAGILDSALDLRDARFVGDPWPDSVRRDVVMLKAQTAVDIDGDGVSETLALIAHESGGSGRFDYVAVVSDTAGVAPTRLIGDRVQVMAWSAGGGEIEATVLRSSVDDAACCPSEIVQARWSWRAAEGIGRASVHGQRRLSMTELDGAYRLASLFGEAIPGAITLELNGGAVGGNAGCNGYFGKMGATSTPGTLQFGPLATTRMACGEDVDALEARYLAALAAVTQFGFLPGKLVLDGPAGALVFDRVQASVK